MKTTIFKYIFKMQLKAMLFVSFFMFCLILLFDFAEVTRKFPISNVEQVLFSMKLSLLRTPNTFCEILHYVYFITATFSLWHLCSSNQMTILKSAGRSPQQILFPFITFAFCIAAIWLFILHPGGNYTEDKYNELAKSQTREANENIWIDYVKDNKLIFIKRIVKNKINGLYIFDIRENKRIFAKQAKINKNKWNLRNITVVNCSSNSTKIVNNMILYNKVSSKLIELLKKPPRKHNIYSLSNVYQIQKADQVCLQLYEFELHKLLANCMYFILFALIAAAICFPINRYRTRTTIAIQLIMIAMILRFANNMVDSLARTNVIGIVPGAWAIVITTLFITIGVLIWKEV